MVTVPRYGEPQARQAPLPGVRVPTELPAAAAGGGEAAARAAGQARGLAQDAGALAAQEGEEAIRSTSAEYVTRISQEETRLKTKLAGVRGKGALEAADQTLAEFDKFHEGLGKEIENEEVRRRVQGHFR